MSRRNGNVWRLPVRAHHIIRCARRRRLTRSHSSSPSKLWDEVSSACPIWDCLSLERHTLPLQDLCRSRGYRELRNTILYGAGRTRHNDPVLAWRLPEFCTSASSPRTILVMYYAYVVCLFSGYYCTHTIRLPTIHRLDPLFLTYDKSDQYSHRRKHVNRIPNALGTQHCGDRRCSDRNRSSSVHRRRSSHLLETETETTA